MKISIIIPIYKVELHIERCLRSVFRQNFEGSIQCILVNDASPDDSIHIAENLIEEYRANGGSICFNIVHHDKNRGLSAARNTGLKKATGEYVYFLDSDDEIMPGAMSSLSALQEKYPNADVICGDWYTANDSNNLQNKRGLSECVSNKAYVVDILLRNMVSVTAQNKFIRRKFIVENGLRFAEGIVHEDELWTYQICKFVKSMAVSYRPIYVYYQNPKGIVGSLSMRNVECYIDILRQIWDDGWWEFPKPKIYTINKILQKAIADFNHVSNNGLGADDKNAEIQNTLNLMQRRLLKDAISNGCYSIAGKSFVKICVPNAMFRRLKSFRQRFL